MAILKTEFKGEGGQLFFLMLKLGFLTVITFGIYGFWARTHLRRWYWSAIRPAGVPFEYSGTGLEKFTGFLFAISILLILWTFGLLGLFILSEQLVLEDAALASVVGAGFVVLSLMFFYFARYRARRYRVSRTSWRGIRMAMSPGAFGYAWRGTLYTLLAIATLGLLTPLATFQLEKYKTDRTWYGNARFTQHGNVFRIAWLILPFLATFFGGYALIVYFVLANGGALSANMQSVWAGIVGNVMIYLSLCFLIYYWVASVRVMTALKTLGDGIEFDLWPRTRSIIWTYFWGSIKVSFATLFATLAFATMLFGILSVTGLMAGLSLSSMPNLSPAVAAMFVLPVYLFAIVMAYVFAQIFIVLPIVRKIALTLEIHQPELLGGIRQRDLDSTLDAEGFAEALDVGAAV